MEEIFITNKIPVKSIMIVDVSIGSYKTEKSEVVKVVY